VAKRYLPDIVGVGLAGVLEAVDRGGAGEPAHIEGEPLIAKHIGLSSAADGIVPSVGDIGVDVIEQNILDRSSGEIVEEFLGKDADGARRVAERGIEPAPLQGVGGGVASCGQFGDDEGRKRDRCVLVDGGRWPGGGEQGGWKKYGQGDGVVEQHAWYFHGWG